MVQASASCFWLLKHTAAVAFCFALLRAGNSIAARMAMMAITTSSSIRVNPEVKRACGSLGFEFQLQ
jgi:hypothetical protein